MKVKIIKSTLLLKEKEQEARIAKQKAGFFARKRAEIWNIVGEKVIEKLGKEENDDKNIKNITNRKQTGQAVSKILKKLKREIKIGSSGKELDKLARQIMEEEKVKSSSLGYNGFPAAICVSLNQELTHGIPDERIFKNGDLVSIDVACNYQGYHADAALTAIVGEGDEKKQNLLKITKDSLYYVIQKIKPNITTTQDIGEMLEKYLKVRQGYYSYYPIKEYGGHGIGENLHQTPFVPNYKTVDRVEVIKEGMFICIEPLVQLGDGQITELMIPPSN
ncbi:11890_t:CDS:2 [Funneliformis geosporum]|uniref:Methionine aminopeptidase n=1 Tax=Funneliformis geosporum TaxID=1117311 RepID=A0A9W4SVH9_9GLOM|nr:11890_t:CDS:2 [Funneliformis geosporum]